MIPLYNLIEGKSPKKSSHIANCAQNANLIVSLQWCDWKHSKVQHRTAIKWSTIKLPDRREHTLTLHSQSTKYHKLKLSSSYSLFTPLLTHVRCKDLLLGCTHDSCLLLLSVWFIFLWYLFSFPCLTFLQCCDFLACLLFFLLQSHSVALAGLKIHFLDQTGLKLTNILLALSSECWD